MLLANLLFTTCLGSISGFLSSPYTGWFPFVFSAVMFVILVLVVVYVISPIVGRSDIRTWTRIKIYETLLSLGFIMVFAIFSGSICTISPNYLYGSVDLLPPPCSNFNSATNNYLEPNNIFSISQCDLWHFNNDALGLANIGIYGVELTSAFAPQLQFEADIGEFLSLPGDTLAVSDAFPLVPNLGFFGLMLKELSLAMLLNQVQLLIIDAAPIIFALFMSVGLISRVFGVTRSFGGAMIAFGLGIGFIYPVLVSVSYGFLEVAIANLSLVSQLSNTPQFILNFAQQGILVVTGISTLSDAGNALLLDIQPLIEFFGIVVAGALIIPLLNFVILDTFIVDFSSAVGERMDFLSLLRSIV